MLNNASVRIMRNESGESRGFGFVSYQTSDQGTGDCLHVNRVLNHSPCYEWRSFWFQVDYRQDSMNPSNCDKRNWRNVLTTMITLEAPVAPQARLRAKLVKVTSDFLAHVMSLLHLDPLSLDTIARTEEERFRQLLQCEFLFSNS